MFEGIDGCGKTTQISLLSKKLASENVPHIVTREPSDSNPVGKLTRDAVHGKFFLENETVALLFAADRFEHIHSEILPSLGRGEHVLCDRYYYSNFAYQGEVAAYNRIAMERMRPDAVFFIDASPEECLRRIKISRPYADGVYENLETLTNVRERYLEIFKVLEKTEKIFCFDGATQTPEGLAEKIYNVWIDNIK